MDADTGLKAGVNETCPMSSERTTVALVQMKCGVEPEENFKRAIDFVRDAAKQGAHIVCLPELFRSQYFCQTEDHANFELAEEVPGRSTVGLGEMAG
jgi:N-carbamoylputrescine amidase